jgi:hypothetical protein
MVLEAGKSKRIVLTPEQHLMGTFCCIIIWQRAYTEIAMS